MAPFENDKNTFQTDHADIKNTVEKLESRLEEAKRDIYDVYSIIGRNSPYYVVCLILNAMMFAAFDHQNELKKLLVIPNEEHDFINMHGTIVEAEHPTIIDDHGNYKTNNGAIDMQTMEVLDNLSEMVGCVVALLIARWPVHRSTTVFTVLIVASNLLSQAFLFDFIDRIAYLISSVLSKALAIVVLQAAFESGHGKYRVWAVGLCYYLNNAFMLITLFLYKKNSIHAGMHFMFLLIATVATYAALCPSQLLLSVIRKDTEKVQDIIDRFGLTKKIDCVALIDDVLYTNHLPQSMLESIRHLSKIRPFFTKIIALTVLISLQSRMKYANFKIMSKLTPFSPLEGFYVSTTVSLCASLLAVLAVLKVGRRLFLLSLLFLDVGCELILSLVPIDSFAECFLREKPTDEHNLKIVSTFIELSMIRTASTITLMLITLEHIPSLHRSFVFPVVMFLDIVIYMANGLISAVEDMYDSTSIFISMIRPSMVSLILAAVFVDNTDFSPFTTEEIPCYNLKNLKPCTVRGTNVEEQFRILCEVKALEKETYKKQDRKHEQEYRNQLEKYYKRKKNKKEIKEKLKNKNIDPATKEELKLQYWARKRRIAKCLEASENKLRLYDKRAQGLVKKIQKNRLEY